MKQHPHENASGVLLVIILLVKKGYIHLYPSVLHNKDQYILILKRKDTD